MEYHRRTANQRSDLVVIANIRALEVDGPPDFLQIAFMPRKQVVDDHDIRRALAQERTDDRRSDEPGATGDHVSARHASRAVSASRWTSDSCARRSAPTLKSKASSDIHPP